jgi:hypothetical protein
LEEITDSDNASLTSAVIDVIGVFVIIATTPAAVAGIGDYRW